MNDLVDQILSFDNLQAAWEKICRNKGVPGLDGVTVERWNRNWEENINRLALQVRSNTYYCCIPKRIKIYKEGGGFREICLFNISDRVLQRAILNILEPVFEKRFLNCSHGYRPHRSCATAIQQVINYRDKKLIWLVDADIEACFDNIDHDILTQRIRKVIHDWFVLRLTEKWLAAGGNKLDRSVGIPQGGVLSPLWCNIYLHLLDARMSCAGWKMVRYADDFLIMGESKEKAQTAFELMVATLEEIKLNYSVQKTKIICFEEGFKFLGVSFLGDSISYWNNDQLIEIKGNDLRLIYKKKPNFY